MWQPQIFSYLQLFLLIAVISLDANSQFLTIYIASQLFAVFSSPFTIVFLLSFTENTKFLPTICMLSISNLKKFGVNLS